MKTYNGFNIAVYEQYFKDRKGDSVILSIDNHFVNNFCKKNKIKEQDLYKEISIFYTKKMFKIEKTTNSMPNYLGIIAIQIYAAHTMRKGKQFTATAYNPRLRKLLNINEQKLQNIHEGIQDNLWKSFEVWCIHNGYMVNIPKPKDGKGRWTQYPLSQALLNQDDLDKLPLLFQKAGLKPFESLSFEDFKIIISNSDENNDLSRNYYRLKDRLEQNNELESLQKQIFTFYLDWDGRLPQVQSSSQNRQTPNKSVSNSHFLVLDCDFENIEEHRLIIYDQNEDIKNSFKISDENVFEKIEEAGYRLPHKGNETILFIKSDEYDEWVENRYLEIDKPCLLFFKRSKNLIRDYIHFLDENFKEIHSTQYYLLYEIIVKAETEIKNFHKFLFSKKNKPYAVKNGLKLSYKSWMFGAGPDFVFQVNCRVWLNGKEKDVSEGCLSCRGLDAGDYVLKVQSYTPFKFKIVKPLYKTTQGNSGWKLLYKDGIWEPSNHEYQISGLNCFTPVTNNESVHRQWVNAVLGSRKEKSKTLVVNALKRLKNVNR
ncbi:MAG: hypothetical protein HQK65_05755 [Desulfamplus sp.]|nr:hypothetical protein [Desulfamplus sp.]